MGARVDKQVPAKFVSPVLELEIATNSASREAGMTGKQPPDDNDQKLYSSSLEILLALSLSIHPRDYRILLQFFFKNRTRDKSS